MLDSLRKLLGPRSSPRGHHDASQENPLMSQLAHLISMKQQPPAAANQTGLSPLTGADSSRQSSAAVSSVRQPISSLPSTRSPRMAVMPASMMGQQVGSDSEALAAMSFRSSGKSRSPRLAAANELPERG